MPAHANVSMKECLYEGSTIKMSNSENGANVRATHATVTRRSFLTTAAAGAAATVTTAAGMPLTHAVAAEEAVDEAGNQLVPTWLVKPEPITDFAQTYEYDVVVVGAGESGLSAVHGALEGGVKVACLQNTDTAFTTGNMAASIDLSKTSEAALQACISFINWKNDYRSDRDLVETWARNSQEALTWWADAGAQGGVESQPYDYTLNYNGYDIYLHANTYFHCDGAHNDSAQIICQQEAEAGCDFYFNTPAVQLQTDGSGAVTGVIGQDADGNYLLFTASKGVILCTGDYTGNIEMRDYYCPDLKGFDPGVALRDGSGYAMGMWAGAVITPPMHTKMCHNEPFPYRLEMPFLFLNYKGERFMDENCGGRMGYLNNYIREYLAETEFANTFVGKIWSIVPNNWQDYVEEWQAVNPYEISTHNAYRDVDPSAWIQADTLEDLCAAINAYMEENGYGLDPIDTQTFVDQVNRYNELCAAGADDDFGKNPMYMVPIDSAPYYAVPRGNADASSAILAGLVIDGNGQCLDQYRRPIPGLFAAGNASGQFFGGVDYPMNIEGLSIGRAITSGYVTGGYVAGL